MNKVILHGRLSQTPDSKITASGISVATTAIAVNEGNDDVVFVKLKAFNKIAEQLCLYCSKGKELIVEGRLTIEKWTDKNGNKRTELYVIVKDFDFCGKREEQPDSQTARQPDSQTKQSMQFETVDDIPF